MNLIMSDRLPYQLIDQVRQSNPVIFTVANEVTTSKVADGLSAIGASPIMSAEPAEAPAMVALANAITINLGTITKQQLTEIHAILNANAGRCPVVLDPVAVGSIPYRHKIANQLLHDYHFTVIRGNAGEIAALAGLDWHAHGIDTGQGELDPIVIANKCAIRYRCCVALTGPTDIITDGHHLFTNPFNNRFLTLNVGSGDMLSSILAAYLTIGNDTFQASALACQTFSLAGIKAANHVQGLGQWQVHFFDELSNLTATIVKNELAERTDNND